MNFVEAAHRAGFIGEATVEALLERLKINPPEFPLAAGPHLGEERLQGDIFKELPFVILKSDGSTRCRQKPCMVLNNACDLQPDRSSRCNLALAIDYVVFKEWEIKNRGETKAAGYLQAVVRNEVSEIFFIPSAPGFDSGVVVCLDYVSTIPFKCFEEALAAGHRASSLTQSGFGVLPGN